MKVLVAGTDPRVREQVVNALIGFDSLIARGYYEALDQFWRHRSELELVVLNDDLDATGGRSAVDLAWTVWQGGLNGSIILLSDASDAEAVLQGVGVGDCHVCPKGDAVRLATLVETRLTSAPA